MKQWFTDLPRWVPHVAPDPPEPSAWLPAGPYPRADANSLGIDPTRLSTARGIQHGIVFRHGFEGYTWGDPDVPLDWASCNRTWMNLIWGTMGLDDGLRVVDLSSAVARTFPPDVLLADLRSYTSQPPAGHVWRYSCGDHWPKQPLIIQDLTGLAIPDVFRQRLQPALQHGTFAPGVADDGTLRVKASVRDTARMIALHFARGAGAIPAEDIEWSISGGPGGDGYPFKWEGYQTHLIRDGRANAGSSQNSPQWITLPGVPDGFMALDGNDSPSSGWGAVVGLPSLDLIVCARGATPAWWLPTIVSAVTA